VIAMLGVWQEDGLEENGYKHVSFRFFGRISTMFSVDYEAFTFHFENEFPVIDCGFRRYGTASFQICNGAASSGKLT